MALPLTGPTLLSLRPFRQSFQTVFLEPPAADIAAFVPFDCF
ncbi:hypothetical protein [Rhodoferax sp.]|nr:hypothetical protein [Rhodoferax sp.]MDD2810308.1 hypothetical protein [Rhodoferax sp.]